MIASANKGFFLAAFFLLCVTVAIPAGAQTVAKKPLFTERPWLCVGSGFVAMVPLSSPQPLVVIRIAGNGIEAPQTIPTTGNEVQGLKCAGSFVELLVVATGADHFSVLPFHIQSSAVEPEQREDIGYSASRKGPTPPEVERKLETFYDILNIRGDWYAEVPRAMHPEHLYEVHFVNVTKQGDTFFAVDILDETPAKKVAHSVPLVRMQVANVYD
jgi:hypothetical protein